MTTDLTLSTIARKYGTDKVTHGFTELYEYHLQSKREHYISVLEIGVFFGASIKMWKEYFSNATIYGADTFSGKQGNGTVFQNADAYYREWESCPDERIKLVRLDQSDEQQLKSFVDKCKADGVKFNLIVDDGSHLMRDQQLTFAYLFELLEAGGVYIIEDIHTSDQSGYDVLPNKSNSTKTMFKLFKNGTPLRTMYFQDTEKLDEISKSIKSIEPYRVKEGSETMFIFKI